MKRHRQQTGTTICSLCGHRIKRREWYWGARLGPGESRHPVGRPRDRYDFHDDCMEQGFKLRSEAPEQFRRVEYDHGDKVPYGLPCRATLLHRDAVMLVGVTETEGVQG